jgi:hypothetical protein
MSAQNPFLHTGSDNKGGGLFLEDPHAVENIACQTAGASPTDFEARFADILMAVFSAGAWELDQILPELETRGCRDRNGSPWTAASLQSQLQESAARLFATDAAPPQLTSS